MAGVEEKVFKVVVREVTNEKTKQTFKTIKFVDEADHNKLVDCILTKQVDEKTQKEIMSCKMAEIKGIYNLSTNFLYPKVFVKSVFEVKKIN